jgi:hypothetical protein
MPFVEVTRSSPTHPVRAEPVEALPLAGRHFDKLSANGIGFVFGVPVFPIILSLSKGKLSANRFIFMSRILKS